MSIFIFFGFCFLVVVVSTIYVTVAIRHLIKNKKDSSMPPTTTNEERH